MTDYKMTCEPAEFESVLGDFSDKVENEKLILKNAMTDEDILKFDLFIRGLLAENEHLRYEVGQLKHLYSLECRKNKCGCDNN